MTVRVVVDRIPGLQSSSDASSESRRLRDEADKQQQNSASTQQDSTEQSVGPLDVSANISEFFEKGRKRLVFRSNPTVTFLGLDHCIRIQSSKWLHQKRRHTIRCCQYTTERLKMLSEWTATRPNGSPVGNSLHHRFSVGNEFFDLIPIHILVARVSPCSIIGTKRYYCSDILSIGSWCQGNKPVTC